MIEKTKERREQAKSLVPAEGNFEEHPYFRVGDRNAGTGILRYENELRTKDGHVLQQSWTVRAVHGRGLPGRFDQDVYVALLQMIDEKGLPEDGWLSFSLYELVELMGRKHSGRDYRQVRESLQRLATTSIESNNAFYHRGRKEYISDTFSLLLEVKLSEYEDASGERADRNRVLLSQYFVDSYKANYLKNIDARLYWSLSSPIAKRLYRLIDKKRNGRRAWEVELFSLKDRIPLSDYKYASKIKEKLAPAHAELIEKDFLEGVDYRKAEKGEFATYKITERFHARKSVAADSPTGDEFFCIQRLRAEGMGSEVAEELVAAYGVEGCMRYVEALPYQKNLRNPAGWLRKAIVSGYELDMPPAKLPPSVFDGQEEQEQTGPAATLVEDHRPLPASPNDRSAAAAKRKREIEELQSRSENPQRSREETELSLSSPRKDSEDEDKPTPGPENLEAHYAWLRLAKDLTSLRGHDSLPPWFEEFAGGELEGSVLTVLVPNSTAANHLHENFGEDLLRLWRERVGPDAALQMAVSLTSNRRAPLGYRNISP